MRVVDRTSGSGDQRIGGAGIHSIMPEGRAYARTDAHAGLATSLAVLVAGGGPLLPPAPLAVVRVPDEPGAIVLPNGAPTLQALAADLDADGAPEVVRLVGGDNGAAWIEAWADGANGWRLMTAPALAVPGRAGQAELAFVGRPVRLLLRRADGEERVTLVRQPDFAEPDDPEECCLLLDDLVLVRQLDPACPGRRSGPRRGHRARHRPRRRRDR